LIQYIPYEKSREEVYALLGSADIQTLKQYVIDLIDQEAVDIAEEIVLELACFTNISLDECLEEFVQAGNYRPSLAFREAPAIIRDYLIQKVQTDACNRNDLLLALAWIGDQIVVDLFNSWRSTPPDWKEELYVPPDEYSYEAGWELTKDGHKRELYYRDCYPLVKRDLVEHTAVEIIGEHNDICPWCGSTLVILFDFNLDHPALKFLELPGTKLRIPTCHICTCFGNIYSEFDGNGHAAWSPMNEKPAYLPELEQGEGIENIHSLVMANDKRSCYHSASQFIETGISQIGGHPTWLQDAEYPRCPKCSQTMKFVGQVDGGDTMQYGEGIYYAFICKACSLAATYYQQT
jgi:hypothetical protein